MYGVPFLSSFTNICEWEGEEVRAEQWVEYKEKKCVRNKGDLNKPTKWDAQGAPNRAS